MPSEPDDAAAHYNLGVALGKKGDPDGAIAEYRGALHLNPNLAEAYDGLGVELGQKGNKDGAIVEFREAIRLKPDFADAHHELGRVLRSEREIRGSTVTRFFGELGFGAGYFLMVALVYVSSRFDGWIFGTTHAITLADLMAFICFSMLWVLWAMNQYYKYFTAPSEERNAFPTSAGPFCPTFAYMPTPGMGVSPAMIIGGAIGAWAGGMATPTHPWVGAFLGVLIGMPGGQMASMGVSILRQSRRL